MAYIKVSPRRSDGKWYAASHRYPLAAYGLGAKPWIKMPKFDPTAFLKQVKAAALKPKVGGIPVVPIAVGLAVLGGAAWWFFIRTKPRVAAATTSL